MLTITSTLAAETRGTDRTASPHSPSAIKAMNRRLFRSRGAGRLSGLLLALTCVTACFFGSGARAYGQIDRGTIEGQVTDPSGAVVPGAKVQVINIATNSALALATDSQGLYTAANLPNGTYRVVITKDGFNTMT
jgi:hypothetical protein